MVTVADAAASEQLVIGGHRWQRPGVRGKVRQPPFVQGRHRRWRAPGNQRACHRYRFDLGLGGFAGFQSDRVRGHGSGPQGRSQAGDYMLMGQVTPQQEDLDQSPGAVPLTMHLAGLVPPGIVDGVNLPAERACSRAVEPGKAPGLRTKTSR